VIGRGAVGRLKPVSSFWNLQEKFPPLYRVKSAYTYIKILISKCQSLAGVGGYWNLIRKREPGASLLSMLALTYV
jgi:hypothetical protein